MAPSVTRGGVTWPMRAALAPEPGFGRGVVLEEAQESSRDLDSAAGRRVGAVGGDVTAGPRQAVPASAQAIGPQVGPPAHPRSAKAMCDAVTDHPAHGERALVGVRLGV